MNNNHLVFVYGTLKKGCSNHHVLSTNLRTGEKNQGYKYRGVDITGDRFEMYDLGAFPALVPDELGDAIAGELYEVDNNTLNQLDNLEGYPEFYDRKLFDMTDGKCQAWVYFLKKSDVKGYKRVTCTNTPYWYVSWKP